MGFCLQLQAQLPKPLHPFLPADNKQHISSLNHLEERGDEECRSAPSHGGHYHAKLFADAAALERDANQSGTFRYPSLPKAILQRVDLLELATAEPGEALLLRWRTIGQQPRGKKPQEDD